MSCHPSFTHTYSMLSSVRTRCNILIWICFHNILGLDVQCVFPAIIEVPDTDNLLEWTTAELESNTSYAD